MSNLKAIWNWNRTITLYNNDCLVNRKDLEIAYATGCVFYALIIGFGVVVCWAF
jgi:hypothetical protein